MTTDNAGLGTIISTDIVVLNDHERTLVKYAFEQLNEEYKSTVLEIGKKLMDLERMSVAISHFPSIHETSILAGQKRSQETLIETLCKTPSDSRTLSMPTKAVLGRGFLVANSIYFLPLPRSLQIHHFQKKKLKNLERLL